MVASKQRDIAPGYFRLNPRSKVPLYLQLRAAIEQGVARGELSPGQRIPPEPDLCASLRVSTTTVKNALGPLVEAGVLYRRPRHGTFIGDAPMVHAVRLDVLVPAPEESFQKAMLADLSVALRVRNYAAEFRPVSSVAELGGTRDAVLCVGPWPPSMLPMLAEAEGAASGPILLLDIPPVRPGLDCVHVANASIAQAVTARLIERGATRVLYCSMGEREQLNDEGRLAGYQAALREAGITPDPAWVMRADEGPDRPSRIIRRLASTGADAVFFPIGGFYGSLLVGLVRQTAGVKEPLVGGIELDPAGVSGTVDYRVEPTDLAEAAARILCRRFEGDTGPAQVVAISGRLVERGGTANGHE
ncbi:MAG: GntR family transcriptional regulator [Kiritimatiellae bacterium]|nr:GntR family transcriptional regulator [Kiritimatiellia bacterium]